MKIKNILIILFFTLTFSVSGQQKMTTSEIATFKSKLIETNKKVKSLTADFVQYKHMDFLSKDIESNGKFYLNGTNELLWKYIKPQEMSILFKNKKMFTKSKGKTNSVDLSSNKRFEQLNDFIVGTYNGNFLDDKNFNISYFMEGSNRIVKLTPKQKDLSKYIKAVELFFKSNEFIVSEVKLIEPSNDYTKIVFKNKVENAKINSSIFNL